jgi:hypothetical protein
VVVIPDDVTVGAECTIVSVAVTNTVGGQQDVECP